MCTPTPKKVVYFAYCESICLRIGCAWCDVGWYVPRGTTPPFQSSVTSVLQQSYRSGQSTRIRLYWGQVWPHRHQRNQAEWRSQLHPRRLEVLPGVEHQSRKPRRHPASILSVQTISPGMTTSCRWRFFQRSGPRCGLGFEPSAWQAGVNARRTGNSDVYCVNHNSMPAQSGGEARFWCRRGCVTSAFAGSLHAGRCVHRGQRQPHSVGGLQRLPTRMLG